MELPPRRGEYLTLAEIRGQVVEIRDEFERLLARPAIASRKNARQWGFLRDCFNALTSGTISDIVRDHSKVTQYRFEVDERLSRYYARAGPPVRYAFSLQHATRAMREGAIDDDYPQCSGYVLLVSNVARAHQRTPERETKFLLEGIIADAMEAEFAVYRALPKIDLSPLEKFFVTDGHAYKRIQHLAEQHHRHRWTIANHNNPSTRRLIAVKKIQLKGDEAFVRTQEYWYLRWWSIKHKKNVYVYDRQNIHTYILVRRGDTWLIEYDIYPPPRESAARRKWS